MPNNCDIILTTEVPVFIDAGDYLCCELTSGGKTRAFRIEWRSAQIAMLRCGAVVDAHFERLKERGNNVRRLPRKGSPLPHG